MGFPAAIWRFLLLRDHDILASLLANEVSVDRNLNYILKFGFDGVDEVRSHGAIDQTMLLDAPSQPGRYSLHLSLVQESRFWFAGLPGSVSKILTLVVSA